MTVRGTFWHKLVKTQNVWKLAIIASSSDRRCHFRGVGPINEGRYVSSGESSVRLFGDLLDSWDMLVVNHSIVAMAFKVIQIHLMKSSARSRIVICSWEYLNDNIAVGFYSRGTLPPLLYFILSTRTCLSVSSRPYFMYNDTGKLDSTGLLSWVFICIFGVTVLDTWGCEF